MSNLCLKPNQSGSVLLVAILLLTGLMMLAGALWYNSSMLLDIACKKELYEQQFRLTEGAFNVGIVHAKSLFTSAGKVKSVKFPIKFTLAPWPPEHSKRMMQQGNKKNSNYHAIVVLDRVERGIHIYAGLKDGDKTVAGQHGILDKNGQLTGWSINAE